MNTEYLELLFQHKFSLKNEIEKMRLIDTFPADTSAHDVHRARLELMEQHLKAHQNLIDAYIEFHSTKAPF